MNLKEEHKQCLIEAFEDDFRGKFQGRTKHLPGWQEIIGMPVFLSGLDYRYVPYKEPTPIPYDFTSFTRNVPANSIIYVRCKNSDKHHYHMVTGYYESGLHVGGQLRHWGELAKNYEWAASSGIGDFNALTWKPFTQEQTQ